MNAKSSNNLIGVFVISCAVLLLEISLTRIFSFSQWYHFGFMVISIALLGFGISGVVVRIYEKKIRDKNSNYLLGNLSKAFSVAVLLGLLGLYIIPLDISALFSSPIQFLFLFFIYSIFIAIFTLSGLIIGLSFRLEVDLSHKIYFANLLGSGFGCLAAILLMGWLTPLAAIAFASLLGMISSWIFTKNLKEKTSYYLISTFIIVAICFMINNYSKIPISSSKILSQSYEDIEHTRWNHLSRIDVVREKTDIGYTPGALFVKGKDFVPDQKMIFIDGDAVTPIVNFEGDYDKLNFIEQLPASLAYQFFDKPTCCIIGAGGGIDVLTALYHHATKVIAVDINPVIFDLVSKKYKDFSGGLYDLNNVKKVVADGRNFIKRTDEKFDIIQLSLVDTWAATSSGAYSLAENYLYTVEAFIDYISHLTPEGILTITRWAFWDPPRETLRLVTLANESLRRLGVEHPEKHIVLLVKNNVGVLLVKKQPFSESDINSINKISRIKSMEKRYVPNGNAQNPYHLYLSMNVKDQNAFYDVYPFNVKPPTDDKPFFFYVSKEGILSLIKKWKGSGFDRNYSGMNILIVTLLQGLLFALFFIILPLTIFYRKRANNKSNSYLAKNIFYFAGIGLGFMLIEMYILQKFTLFLGHPTYAISVTLASILIFSGLGCKLGELISISDKNKIFISILGLLITLIVYYISIDVIFAQFLPYKIHTRILISLALIFPAGIFMGIPFPTVFKKIGQESPDILGWMWGINGFSSVIGSVLAVIIAMILGVPAVLKFAMLSYLFALMSMISLLKERPIG